MRFTLFVEPDREVQQETAIATTIITGDARRWFKRFQLLKEETKMSDHKCTDQILEEFNTGVYKDRAGRGYHPFSYETHLKLKALKKLYWATARHLAEHFRWAAKRPENRVRRERVRDDKGRVISEKARIWPEPTVCWMFVTSRARHWNMTKTIPEHMADFGILWAYEQGRKPRSKEDVLLLKPTLITTEVIDKLFDDVSRWQAESILGLSQSKAA